MTEKNDDASGVYRKFDENWLKKIYIHTKNN